jgi:hypothetical protein
MDDALKRATTAVEQYGAPEPMIGAAQRSLAGMEKDRRLCLEAEALGGAVLEIAEAHAGPHPSCPTCVSLRNGLAVQMGILRAEVDVEFAAKLGD